MNLDEKFIADYLNETKDIVGRINQKDISDFINILFDAWKNKKKVITIGNGGSSATAEHFTGDLIKTVVNTSSQKEIVDGQRGFNSICLSDNVPSLTAWTNDSGWENAYTGLLNTLLDEGDVVLIISVHGGSGWSNNIVGAVEFARKRNAKVIGLAGFDGGALKKMADCCIVVPFDSTPHTEGLHGVIQHLVVERLTYLVQKELEKEKPIILFADTASLEEIEYSFSRGVNNGITTNPKIMESTGDLSNGFEEACKKILSKYTSVPVSLETDLRGISPSEIHLVPEKVRDVLLSQADVLSDFQENVVVKIPLCEGGLLATKILSQRGIKTNVTACMTPYQALEAARAGATYVSLFANRMLDSNILELAGYSLDEISKNPNWKEILKENKSHYFEEAWERVLDEITYVAKTLEGTESKLIVGSIRSPEDILRIASCKPQVITIPTKIVEGLEDINLLKKSVRKRAIKNVNKGYSLYHPMTQYTLEEFEKSADAYRKRPSQD